MSSRTEDLADVDPDRFMPTQLASAFSRVRHLRTINTTSTNSNRGGQEEIPVIAFGVQVPKPNFG